MADSVSMPEKPFVFVLMPFASEFTDVYRLGIKPACEEAGAQCERVDEQYFDELVLQRIYGQIREADVIVAEMSGNNPNVFYEVGYAHALNKRVILLSDDQQSIPFDLTQYQHIAYGGCLTTLKTGLVNKLRWCWENQLEVQQVAVPAVELRLEDRPLADGMVLYIKENALMVGIWTGLYRHNKFHPVKEFSLEIICFDRFTVLTNDILISITGLWQSEFRPSEAVDMEWSYTNDVVHIRLKSPLLPGMTRELGKMVVQQRHDPSRLLARESSPDDLRPQQVGIRLGWKTGYHDFNINFERR